MGNNKSKNITGKRKGKKENDIKTNENKDPDTVARDNEYEDMEIKWLRRTIRNDPEVFVLNNLMMCVQFFGNYEEDIEEIRKSLVSPQEMKINQDLRCNKHVLLPDVLQEVVARNVGFTSSRQTARPTIEPLQPVRIYVVHDNIEITEEEEPTYYSAMDSTMTYNMILKPTHHQGYVKLRLLEESPLKMVEEESDSSSTPKNDDGFYSDGESVYGPKYSRNAAMNRLSRQSKSSIRSSKYGQSQSTPNLYESDTLYEQAEENVYGTKDARESVKADSSDYQTDSLTEGSSSQAPEPPARNGYPGRGGNGRRSSSNRQKSKIYSSNSRASSTSSGYRSSHYILDSDSDYGYGRSSNVSRSCDDLYSTANNLKNSDEELDMDRIPRRCFKKITYTSEGKIYDPNEEKKYVMNSKQKRIRQALKRYNYNVFYVSSAYFMRHFHNLFVQQLAEILGFDQEAIEDVKPEGGVINCDKVIVSNTTRLTLVEPYEIIPCIWAQWPEDANEWLNRPRTTWPNEEDIGKIKDYGCYIIPEGYSPKKHINPFQNIEWQLTFPAAERYLETCMYASQMHVYLMALTLHKTFIRPVFDTMFGLTTTHFRNRLFWMIEGNDTRTKWPDHRTGECLVQLLKSLYVCTSQNEPTLRDYFIRDKNLFQRVPSEHLLHTQKQLKRILENPLMYVFHAMENVRYSQTFFPKIDFDMLLKILTADTLTLINPALGGRISRPISKSTNGDSKDKSGRREYVSDRPGGFWSNAKNMSRTDDQIYASKPIVTNKTLINPRKASDSIIEISVRCAELESTRLCALLDFFITHFIKMGDRCHQYNAMRQKNIYLDHAERLSIILSEYPRYKEDAKKYREKIEKLRMRNLVTKPENTSSQMSERNGEKPLFAMQLKDRFTEETYPKLSIVTKEALHFGIQGESLDAPVSVTKTAIQERPRAPTPSRTPPLSSRATSPLPREPSSSTKRTKGLTDKSSVDSIKRAPTPVKRNTHDRESSKSSRRSPTKDRDDRSTSATKTTRANIQEEPSPRVLSLVEHGNDSFVTETTYI